MIELSKDYERIYDNIIDHTGRYIQKHKLQSVVIGLSGGIDSTLTAALADAIAWDIDVHLRIIGVSIPSMTNHQAEIERARKTGEAFCDELHVMGKGFGTKRYTLDSILKAFTSRLKPYNKIFPIPIAIRNRSSRMQKVGRGNLKARIRMAILYDIAHHRSGMVLSTDNYTEYLLGFWTLHGDVGDFGMFQNLFKTEVYGLAKYVSTRLVKKGWKNKKLPLQIEALREAASAIPTDGLGLGSDMDQIGASNYYQVDKVLLKHLNDVPIVSPYIAERMTADRIIKRHKSTNYKRHNPYNIPREGLLK